MRARIYPARPDRHAVRHRQDAGLGAGVRARTAAREVDPLMGWTSSSDTQAPGAADASKAARRPRTMPREKGIDFVVTQPKPRKPNIRPRGYGENFATDRRGAWTH